MNTTFAGLHVPGSPLVIPNAWDVASAAILVSAGALAVATTSGGVSWSNGYADGDHLTPKDVLRTATQMRSVVDVPVSVDIESGHSTDSGDVASLVSELRDIGIAGINIEDSVGGALQDPGIQLSHIGAIASWTPEVLVNARIDAFLHAPADAEREVIARISGLAEAGANCIFLPGVTDLPVLERVVSASPLPIAVMAGAGSPSVADFANVGIARVSVGTGLAEAAYARLREDARAILTTGRFDVLARGYGYAELNALFRS